MCRQERSEGRLVRLRGFRYFALRHMRIVGPVRVAERGKKDFLADFEFSEDGA